MAGVFCHYGSSLSNCCLGQFIDWHNTEHDTHSVKFYTHTQTPGDQFQCLRLVPSPSAAVGDWRISWDRKSTCKLPINRWVQVWLNLPISFSYWGRGRDKGPEQLAYEPCNNHLVQQLNHFLGQKHGFQELFCSTSDPYSPLHTLVDQKRGGEL